MKKFLVLAVSLLLFGFINPFSANANMHDTEMGSNSSMNDDQEGMNDDQEGMNDDQEGMNDDQEGMNASRRPVTTSFKAKKTKMKEIKEMKRDYMEGIKGNREEARKNREDFRKEYKDEYKKVRSELSEEQKSDLEDIKDNFSRFMDDLREQLKNADTEEEKMKIHEEMKQVVESQYTSIKEIVGKSTEGRSIVDARKNVWTENETLREENRDSRSSFRETRKETVKKYKKAFVKRLGKRLDSISADKLEKIASRIDTMIQKFEKNTTISEKRQEAMLSALAALKDIVEEKIEGDNTESEVLDVIEGLLN